MSLWIATKVASRFSVAAVGGTAITLSAGEYMGSDSGPVRSFQFWKGMVPIYIHYKLIEWRLRHETNPETISKAYRPLNQRYSPRVKQLALSLKGFYYKLAQILSTRDDFLPKEYDWTKQLQDQSPDVLPSSEIQQIVSTSLGVQVSDLFSAWQDEPIGAASVGQVHRATLAKDGTEVAVKVQYPGIERKFRNDIDTVEMFCKYLMPQNVAFFREIKKQFATEFDMRGEACNLKDVHDNLKKAGWLDKVDIPYPLHYSKDVLVMTYLPGVKLVDGVRKQFERLAKLKGRTLEEVEAEQRRAIEEGNARLVDISTAMRQARRVELILDLRNAIVNSAIFLMRWTIGWPFSSFRFTYWDREAQFVNLPEVIDILIRVHGHEIFTDGAFNGDPHPGNIMLLDDGRIGLVDYGQVKRMSVEDRTQYAKLILALNRNDRAEVIRIVTEDGQFRTKYMNEDVIYRSMAFFHCRDTEDVLQGMNVSQFMDWMEKTDPIVQINDEFVMVGRVSVLIRGLANAFGFKVRVSDYWKEEAQNFLESQGIST